MGISIKVMGRENTMRRLISNDDRELGIFFFRWGVPITKSTDLLSPSAVQHHNTKSSRCGILEDKETTIIYNHIGNRHCDRVYILLAGLHLWLIWLAAFLKRCSLHNNWTNQSMWKTQPSLNFDFVLISRTSKLYHGMIASSLLYIWQILPVVFLI